MAGIDWVDEMVLAVSLRQKREEGHLGIGVEGVHSDIVVEEAPLEKDLDCSEMLVVVDHSGIEVDQNSGCRAVETAAEAKRHEALETAEWRERQSQEIVVEKIEEAAGRAYLADRMIVDMMHM